MTLPVLFKQIKLGNYKEREIVIVLETAEELLDGMRV